jgi:hypothetical protein
MISFSLNNFKLGDYVDRIYAIEIDISDRPALNLDVDSDNQLRLTIYDLRDDFNFPIVNFPFICDKMHLHKSVYFSELMVVIMISSKQAVCWKRGFNITKHSLWSRSHHFESFTVANMTWIAVTEWPWICSLCHRKNTIVPRSWRIAWFFTRIIWRVSLVEQELLTNQEHLVASVYFCWILVLYRSL